MNNCTVTIKRKGSTIDQTTGQKTAGTERIILRDQPCIITQDSKLGRTAYASGLREYNKPIDTVIFDDVLGVEIYAGDVAVIDIQTESRVMTSAYIVSGANLSPGITSSKWFVTLERIKTR